MAVAVQTIQCIANQFFRRSSAARSAIIGVTQYRARQLGCTTGRRQHTSVQPQAKNKLSLIQVSVSCLRTTAGTTHATLCHEAWLYM